jgi:hypothetical protein
MKTVYLKFTRLGWMIFFSVVAWSCQDDEANMKLTPEDRKKQAEQSAVMSSNFVAASHDILDLTAGAMAGQGFENGRSTPYGRTEGGIDINCRPNISGTFNVDNSHPDSVVVTGTLTLDFGDGSNCSDTTEVITGKISDSFVLLFGTKISTGYDLTETITLEGFHKDTVGIDGMFISKSASHKLTSLTINNVKITYDNGVSSTWDGSLTNTYIKGPEWGIMDDSKEVTGSLTVTPGVGVAFSAEITKAMLFQYFCSKKIPVSGTIDLTLDAVTSTVDFGTGTCDKTYTVTTNGEVSELTFPAKNHHGDDDDD